ncbi:tubulin--tyrosine ligase [Coemansia sp. RSA 1200]|nr:tubulin--tyrosine ligase [Coemansia sp. RSA 1200]
MDPKGPEDRDAAVASVIVDMDEPYVQTILESTFAKYAPLVSIQTKDLQDGMHPKRLMHWREYERIDWDAVHRSEVVFSNAYCFRKDTMLPSILSPFLRGVPETWILELDDIDYLDEALMECYEVEDDMKINEDEDEDEDDDEGDNQDQQQNAIRSYEAVSQIREWVVQRYISNPLLLKSHDERKFHIRVYALAVGDLKDYVYRQMLALFAPESYTQSETNLNNQGAHITNTCVQEKRHDFDEAKAVELFGNLDMSQQKRESIFDQICQILSETFAAVSSESTSFQTWPNCMEQFGFDFLVDVNYNVYLLEANAYPDFKQTGERLRSVVEGFMAASAATAAETFLLDNDALTDNALHQAIEKDKSDLVQVFAHKISKGW